MELPVLVVPVDVAAEVQGEVPIRPIVQDPERVARPDGRSAQAFRLPVLIEFDVDLPGRRPYHQDIPHIVAEDLVVRIGGAAVDVLEVIRAIVEGQAVIAQVDAVHLDEGGDGFSVRVPDKAGRGERTFVGNPAGGRSRSIAAPVERLRRIRRGQDVREILRVPREGDLVGWYYRQH